MNNHPQKPKGGETERGQVEFCHFFNAFSAFPRRQFPVNAQGCYKGIDSATQQAAQKILEEIRTQPANISATAIGVDLKARTIRVSPWPRGE